MNYPILSAILLALGASAAHAQSTVTIYGVMDAGLLAGKFSAAGSQRAVATNTITASKLGFIGSEDLGGGFKANFQLEHGLFVDTGTPGSATTFWNRGSWVGLGTPVGEVRVGRQRSPMFTLFLNVDPSGYGIASLSSTNVLHGQDAIGRAGTTSFYDNLIVYKSPAFSGFNVDAAYSPGAGKPAPADQDARTAVLTGQYKQGNLWLAAGVQQYTVYETTLTEDRKQTTYLLGAKYVMGAVTLAGDLVHAKRDLVGRPASAKGAGLQAQIRVGTGDIDVGIATLRESGDRRANAVHLGYIHHLSKRTGVYVYGGLTRNNENAGYTYGAELRDGEPLSPTGFDPRAIAVGIRHGF